MYCVSCGHKINEDQKFCANCGTKLADDAVFCGACGTTMSATLAQNTASGKESDSFFNKNKVMLGIIIGAAVALILAIVLVVCLAGSGYKAPLKKYIALINARCTDYEKFNSFTIPKFQQTYANDYKALIKSTMSKSDWEDYCEDTYPDPGDYKDAYDDWADEYGKNWKIKVEIKNIDELKRRELNEVQGYYNDYLSEVFEDLADDDDAIEYFLDDLEDEYDAKTKGVDKKLAKLYETYSKQLKKAKVTKGYKIDVKLTIAGKEDDDTDKATIYVYKVNGKWVLDADDMPF